MNSFKIIKKGLRFGCGFCEGSFLKVFTLFSFSFSFGGGGVGRRNIAPSNFS